MTAELGDQIVQLLAIGADRPDDTSVDIPWQVGHQAALLIEQVVNDLLVAG